MKYCLPLTDLAALFIPLEIEATAQQRRLGTAQWRFLLEMVAGMARIKHAYCDGYISCFLYDAQNYNLSRGENSLPNRH